MEQCWTVPPGPYPHWRPAFGIYGTEFVYPACWHFDNGAASKIDHVLKRYVVGAHRILVSASVLWFGFGD